MLQYLPWSQHVLDACLEAYKQGNFTILDLELGGSCNLHCLYCDSPNRKTKAIWSIKQIEILLSSGDAKWLFLCGLGEPFAMGNYKRFLDILKLCDKYSIKCSAFSNGIFIDDTIRQHVKEGTLSLLMKLDSLDPHVGNRIYGKEVTNLILKNLESLAAIKNESKETTNIGVSIVPTKWNFKEIPNIVKYCMSIHVFPLIGQLEDAGQGHKAMLQIGLSDNEILKMREEVSEEIGEKYIIPTCPAVIAAVHIGHKGKVIVDQFTGLSCHWFWLKTPKTQTLTDLSSCMGWNHCTKDILTYRAKRLSDIEKELSSLSQFPLGGCGGNARYLLERYVTIERNRGK